MNSRTQPAKAGRESLREGPQSIPAARLTGSASPDDSHKINLKSLWRRVQSLWVSPQERYSRTDPRTTAIDHEYFEFYARQIVPMVKGPRVLDLGCGEGWLDLEIAKDNGVNLIMAIDREPIKVKHWKIEARRGELPGCPIPGVYDTIVATEFVEHISEADLDALCLSMKPHLRGYVVGCTPERTRPTTNPFHLREYTLPELNTALRRHFQDGYIWREPWRDSAILFFRVK